MKMFQTSSEWLIRLIWTNLLWIGFTVLGLGIFGVMPATVALFTVVRKWVMKEYDISVWDTFKKTYVKEWKKSNLIGLIFAVIGSLIFLDLSFSEQMTGVFSLFLYVFFLVLMVVCALTLIFFFPVYVHYTFPMKEYMKQSLFHAISSIKDLFILAIGFGCIIYFFFKVPGLIPFLGIVLPSFWIMKVCMSRFNEIEKQLSAETQSNT